MHGREGEERRKPQHMLQVPTGAGAVAAAAEAAAAEGDSKRNSKDFFVKDGREVQVGDCALFQAGNAPPFIGLIRWLNTGSEDYLRLGVNWLYRPADIKLPKGVPLEAAPNEIFYSFHRDEVPAASLLHPCKVAFLRKGVELPTGISSFVCRRVYDVVNKRLWWLTDQDYINERQEEVDQLLDRTRLEMHAAVQSGGRSPKPSNGSSSTQQLKSVSDSAQNSNSSFPPQSKGRKRERSETETIKRERYLKTEDGDSVSSKLDSMLKAEIAKITEKGGLVSIEAVEKLVQLMQLDRAERKLDFGGRMLLVDVISSTDRYDCLGRFLQLRGVSVLDEWLQEAHRGKAGDGSSPKESEKSVEELLLALLRALDKLPVNLNALQTCNIGKSVNQLRSHKNLEIQKKARFLVETWKKRVDAEMAKINDAKSSSSCQAVSWPVKQGFGEVSQAGNRRSAPTELVVKGPITQTSTCKALQSKPGHADTAMKSNPVSSGPLRSSPLPAPISSNSKDTNVKAATNTGNSEVILASIKEERSSSSSQSQTNSQSCSGDHVKTTSSSWKEDTKSSTTGSVVPSKTSTGTSRHRRSSNGHVGTMTTTAPKETNMGKLGSVNRTMLDRATPSGLTSERQPDVPVADLGNSSHRLIVRLPNPGRSPARSASGGSLEDPSVSGSRASSPSIHDKNDHIDRKPKIKADACRADICIDGQTEPWQGNDMKEGLVGPDEAVKLQATIAEEQHCRNADENGKTIDASRASSSLSGNQKEVSLHESKIRNSFSPMNALIESCANEANASLSSGDEIGMNLLASVAAGEMSKTDLISPAGSPRSLPEMENNESKSRLSCDGLVGQSNAQPPDNAIADSEKHEKSTGSLIARDDSQQSASVPGDDKTVVPFPENKMAGLEEGRSNSCFHLSASPADGKEELVGDDTNPQGDNQKAIGHVNDTFTDSMTKVKSLVGDESKSVDCVAEKIVDTVIPNATCRTTGDVCDTKDAFSIRKLENIVPEDSSCLHSTIDTRKKDIGEVCSVTAVSENVHSEKIDDSNTDRLSSLGGRSPLAPGDNERKEQTNVASTNDDHHQTTDTKATDDISGREEAADHNYTISAKLEVSPTIPAHESEQSAKSTGSKVSGLDADHSEEPVSSTDASLASNAGPDCTSKIDFDLNEGILGDDGHQSEPTAMPAAIVSSAIHFPGLSHFASPSMPNGTITVAAPAKGPFVPPENLLKSKPEPGWKGSAATSAFRPAEPRKVLEMPLSTSDVPSSDSNAGKHGRTVLDIDLNVPDERVLEDMASQSSAQTTGSESGVVNNRDAARRMAGGLDLDLNRVDEALDSGLFLTNTSRRLEVPMIPGRAVQLGLPNGDSNSLRGFDLNGPGIDEAGVDPGMHTQQANSSSTPLISPIAGLRMNSTDIGNVSTWLPPGNSYPAVAIPSFLHDRGEHPYPIVSAAGSHRIPGPASGTSTFGADVYRHSVLSSSPAMAFSHTTSFPYAGFAFGSSFPVGSNSFPGGPSAYGGSSAGVTPCFPAIPSPMMGPAGPVSTHYPRPYVISLQESTSGGPENSRKWARSGLDLNTGPGSADVEARDDRSSSGPRQFSIASSQAFLEEQARMYQMAGASLKRKEPESGWDAERFAYKQPSWQ